MSHYVPRRGSYGIDAPYAFAFISFMVFLELALAIVVAVTSGRFGLFFAVFFVFMIAALYLHFTLRGKFLVWAELLDQLNLRGDERILDMGCGRGAVLLMAAQRLTTGRAVGVDLWRGFDQSGNSADATRRNAAAEGVAERIELHTGNMSALPFEDNSFDLIVSSLAIHNIPGRARARAIDEAVRVLRPHGRLIITDVRGTRQHQKQLIRLGMLDVTRRRPCWRHWWACLLGVLQARKPANGK
jgi:ubiquinone/menaquinone biosynthesis C-methylase UbiE